MKPVWGLQPFLTLNNAIPPVYNGTGLEKIRLGQRVERFVTAELKQFEDIHVIAENLQIRTENKQTIGELDVLIKEGAQLTHLEIQFKYYLYDPALGTTEIDHCIGPMRRDTLNQKLAKLKEKQFPMLYAEETKRYLDQLEVKAADFVQKIYFKAQIFLPYGSAITLKTLNPECVYGYYVRYADFEQFAKAQFYKPKKTDWLLDVSLDVPWVSYEEVLPMMKHYQEEQYAPMLWIRHENNEVIKCFAVL